eukprot:scpid60076/ scgid31890/ Probable G-protein coupled receptor 157
MDMAQYPDDWRAGGDDTYYDQFYFDGDAASNGSTSGTGCNRTVAADDVFTNASQGIGISVAVLSMLGSLFLLGSTLRWKDLRTVSRKILCHIAVADFITALGNLLGQAMRLDVVEFPSGVGINGTSVNLTDAEIDKAYHPTMCVVQSALTTTSSLSSFFWTCYFAYYLRKSIEQMETTINRPKWTLGVVGGWCVPIVAAVVAVATGTLGADKSISVSAGWCFIRGVHGDTFTGKDKIIASLFLGKFWEVLTYVYIVYAYWRVKRFIGKNDEHQSFVTQGSVRAVQEIDKKLTLIPVIFICIRIWGTIRFIMSTIPTADCVSTGYFWADRAFFLLQSVGDSSQGLANAILFVIMTKKVRRRLLRFFCCCCPLAADTAPLAARRTGERTPIMTYHHQSPQRSALPGQRSRRLSSNTSSAAMPAGGPNGDGDKPLHRYKRLDASTPPRRQHESDFFGGGILVDHNPSDESGDDQVPTGALIQT